MTETKRPGAQALLPAAVAGAVGGAVAAALLLFIVARDSEDIVREGLLGDPQVLTEATDILAGQKTAASAHRSALETPFGSSWAGAANPEVVLVEFFDYACAYCIAAKPDIERLLREDKGLRVVYRELPILGPESEDAARVSLAASKAGRFRQYHDALFAAGAPHSDAIAQGAKTAGIQPNLPSDPLVETEIGRNKEIARQLGITGTPSYVVGDRVIKGALGYKAMKGAIASARRNASRS